jgi:hypothetical protein
MPDTKKCSKCGEIKPVGDFHRSKQDSQGRQSRCKACCKEYAALPSSRIKAAERSRRSIEKNGRYKLSDEQRVAINERQRALYAENRATFLVMYGGSCVLCDPNNPDAYVPEFLSLDHTKQDGNIERKAGHTSSRYAVAEAIKSGVPDYARFRILCHNHNHSLNRTKNH